MWDYQNVNPQTWLQKKSCAIALMLQRVFKNATKCNHRDVSLRLKTILLWRLLVDIYPLNDRVSTMMQCSGKDQIPNKKVAWLPPSLSHQRSLKFASATAEVKVLKAHSHNLALPVISKGIGKLKLALQDFLTPPRAIRLFFRMLRQISVLNAPSYSHPSIDLIDRSFDDSSATKPYELCEQEWSRIKHKRWWWCVRNFWGIIIQ